VHSDKGGEVAQDAKSAQDAKLSQDFFSQKKAVYAV